MKYGVGFVLFTGAMSLATSVAFHLAGFDTANVMVVVVGIWSVVYLVGAWLWSKRKSKVSAKDTKEQEEPEDA